MLTPCKGGYVVVGPLSFVLIGLIINSPIFISYMTLALEKLAKIRAGNQLVLSGLSFLSFSLYLPQNIQL
jgi:hypothetical protein